MLPGYARTRGVGRLVDFGGLMGQSDRSDVSLVFLLFRILTCFDSWHDVSVLVRSCAHPLHFLIPGGCTQNAHNFVDPHTGELVKHLKKKEPSKAKAKARARQLQKHSTCLFFPMFLGWIVHVFPCNWTLGHSCVLVGRFCWREGRYFRSSLRVEWLRAHPRGSYDLWTHCRCMRLRC